MALNFTFIPLKGNSSPANTLDLDDIPQEVKDGVEEVYAALKSNPSGRMGIAFETPVEAQTFIAQVKSYCELRPAGPLYYRKSPVRGAKPNEVFFRITDVPKDNATEGIRQAVETVKAAAPVKAVARGK